MSSRFRLLCLLVLGLVVSYASAAFGQTCPPPERDQYEPDNTPGRAHAIKPDEKQTRSLHESTDVDWARFRLRVRSNVRLETSGSTGDTLLSLYGPDSSSQLIKRDDNGGEGSFSRISQNRLEPGVYYVKVTAQGQNSAIAEYSLRLSTEPAGDRYEPDDTPSRANEIAPNTSQRRSLDAATDVDWVRFTLAQQADVTLETNGAAGDTELALFGPDADAAPIAVDDNGNGLFSRIELPALPAGSYLVRVRTPQDEPVESYSLSLFVGDAFELDDTPETARPIAMGEAQEHGIHRLGDVDWVRFTLQAAGTVTLETNGPAGDTLLSLFAEGQLEFPIAEDDNGNGTFSRIAMQTLPAGSYLVRVRVPGDAARIGRYTLRLTNTDPYEPDDTPTTPSEIAVGETQFRSLYGSTDVDWVRLMVTTATTLTIETAGETGDTELLLFSAGPQIRKLATNNDSGVDRFSRIRRKLTPGTYLIQVRAFRSRAEVPRYTLSVR